MNTLSGPLYIDGPLQANPVVLSDNSLSNRHIASNAAIDCSKMYHRFRAQYIYPSTVSSGTFPLHTILSSYQATLVSFNVLISVIGTTPAVCTVDLKKVAAGAAMASAASVLSAAIDVCNTVASAWSCITVNTQTEGSLSTTTLDAGDTLYAVVTATAGGGTLPSGLIILADIDEYNI